MISPARNWNLPGAPTAQSLDLAGRLGVSRLVADVLVGLGLADEPGARAFLAPDPAQLIDPFAFPAMAEACERIHRAVKQGEFIIVYGDYDVDGMTAATLVFWVLRKLGARCEIFIPDRMTAGYGMSCEAVRALHERGASLIITVDNGVSAVKEIAYAASLGVSVIVTDHHTLPDALPAEAILLHPRLPGREYPFGHLCGAGVAYKLGLALLGSSGLADRDESRERFARNTVDIVAIGTVADMAPLIGENRILVKQGLLQLSRSEHPGLRALLGLERLVGQRLTAEHIGFKICPKINAAGRIDDHRIALQLLMARDAATASSLALKLSRINHERIRLVTELMAQARSEQARWADRALPVVVLQTDKKGLVGLVAQRLKEAHHKPFLVLASDGRTATGSGRSVEGFDLVEALAAQSQHLERFGGHAMAAGFTIACDRISVFADELDRAASGMLASRPATPPLDVRAVLQADAINELTLADLDRLAPFGQGNPAPLLALRQVPISGAERLGDGKHVRLQSSAIPRGIKNVGFNLSGDVDEALKCSSLLDLAFFLETDNWGGRESLQMRLQAVRPAIS